LLSILFNLIIYILNLLTWSVILGAVISTLIAFNVLDSRNRLVWSAADFFARVNDPMLRPIRRRMPNTGNIDFSPLVLLILLQMVLIPLVGYIYRGLATGYWPLF
jgi:YggT family protein